MQQNKKLVNLSIVFTVLLAGISVFYYFVIFLPQNTQVNIINKTLKCNQLYEIKKQKYFSDIGQSKAIFNKKLNTCLALNIYNDVYTGKYYTMVLDMKNDKTLLYYSTEKNELRDIDAEFMGKKYDWSIDDMFNAVRDFGFKVFDGFSSE